MPKPQRHLAREQFWRQTLADWQTSGLTVRAFCDARYLRPTTFDYWKRELQRRDQANSSAPANPNSTPRSAQPKFVPVTLVGTPSIEDDTPIPVQDPDREQCRTARLWTYVSIYDELVRLSKGMVVTVGCWAHLRRKFVEAQKRTIPELEKYLGEALDCFSPEVCENYFVTCGYPLAVST